MNHKHRFQNLFSLFLLALIIGGLFFLFTTRDVQRSENPFLERDTEVSPMYQEEQAHLTVEDPSLPSENLSDTEELSSENPAREQSESESESDTESETEQMTASQDQSENPESETRQELLTGFDPELSDDSTTGNESDSDNSTDSGNDSNSDNSTDSGNDSDSGNSSDHSDTGTGTGDNPSSSETLPDLLPPADVPSESDGTGETVRETDLVYFTTNLINGSTLSSREVEVVLTHKLAYYTPLSETVMVNGSAFPFTGHLLLEEGKNTIEFLVAYSDQEGHQIDVSKTYTIYVELEKVAITTDLFDRTINQRSFAFTAYASVGSNRIPLSVQVNGISQDPSGNRYQTTLEEGSNEIVLYAASGDSQQEQRYNIQVELPAQMQLSTDLYDHEVDNPNFSFTAELIGGTENASLTVVANGETLSGNAGVYNTSLSRGNNFIRLKASDVDGAEITQEFVISYHNYIVMEGDEADASMPHIITNVTDNMTLSSTVYSLQVRGEDGTGERIYGDHLTVELNGSTLEDRSEDGNTTYYQLDLLSGPNSLVVTVWDYEDRYTIFRYTIHCDAVPDGERIGSITVSVEATTVGLGYLIPPTTVDIYQGQNLVVPVATVLEENGFQYQYSGSLENGFYLMHLIRDGITDGYHIPDDLVAAIDQDGLMWTNEYYTQSLGEFDFTQGSGWMYTINGSGGMGMSDIWPSDGDVVCLRYTLAYGRDIGLGMGADGSNHNYSQEW